MTPKQRSRLATSYKKYRTATRKRKRVLEFLRAFMPEIIYRTTRLEGEKVTRRMIASLFR